MNKYFFYKAAYCALSLLFLWMGCSINIVQAQDFKEWKENYLNEFQEFQNENDKQFHEMLQNEWKEFDVKLSPNFYDEPKPGVIPTVEESPAPKPKPGVPKETADKSKTAKTGKIAPPEPKKTAAKEAPKNNLNKSEILSIAKGITPIFKPNIEKAKIENRQLNYFGIPINYKYYAAYKTEIDRPIGKKSISAFWKHLSTKDYPAFLDQIKQVHTQLSLNDYGYAQLIHNIGNQIYGYHSKEATLFTWFMLTQSNYGTRIAYNKQNIYLLVKATPNLFHTTYFTIDGEKYYGINFNDAESNLPSNLYTYEGTYPKSEEREIDLRFSRLPALSPETEERTLEFTFRDSSYSIKIPVDKTVVGYFENYPKADLDLYFNSRMDGETHDKLIGSLEPFLRDKSTLEKVNFLLRFTQRSFEYQTDQEQFNTEKKMFPMETLYYPASDCDDRSILFVYLIKHLTDLEYIVVRYPGHLTPAIHFPGEQPQGARVNSPLTYKGKTYYVTDPTFMGADAGMVMSKYQDTHPKEIFDL